MPEDRRYFNPNTSGWNSCQAFFLIHDKESTEISRQYKISHGRESIRGRWYDSSRFLYLDSSQRQPVSRNWKARIAEERKRSTTGTKFHLSSCRGWLAKMTCYGYIPRVDISCPTVCIVTCFPRVYLNKQRRRPHKARRKGGEKQAGKKARFNGRNEFPSHMERYCFRLIFHLPFVNAPPRCRLFVNLRWNNTDHVDLSMLSSMYIHMYVYLYRYIQWSGLLKFMCASLQTRRIESQRKDARNGRLTSFGCEIDIPRMVIVSATGRSHRIMVFRGNRERTYPEGR